MQFLRRWSPALSVGHWLANIVSIVIVIVNLHYIDSNANPPPVILTVKDQSQPGAKLIFNHASGSAKWRVRVSIFIIVFKIITDYHINGYGGELWY